MARVTYVKKAQARFKTVPVLNEDGTQKVVPVMGRNGVQKTNKHGRPTVRRLTVEDPNQPLPNRKCDKCGVEIEVGSPYKWVAPKSGPYGGTKRFRCGTCPSWAVWELSQSLSARLSQIDSEARSAMDEEDPESVADALRQAAEAVRELSEEKKESAQNIEDGFGHATEKSDELNDIADQLESWADELESAADEASDIEVGEEMVDCEECQGSGTIENPDYDPETDEESEAEMECEHCEDGQVENPDRETALDELQDKIGVLDNVPV